MHLIKDCYFNPYNYQHKGVYVILLLVLLTYFACDKDPAISGYFRMNRVEVFQNDKLARIIDTGFQYWNFSRSSTINIYNKEKVQNVLYINANKKRIQSLDRHTGKMREEFTIRKWDRQWLELSSIKIVNKNTYSIIYFLEKLSDSDLNREFPGHPQ